MSNNNMVLMTDDFCLDISDIQLERGFYWVYSNGRIITCILASCYKIVFMNRSCNENYYRLIKR